MKELRSFLGIAGYYKKYVQNFGMIAKPLTNLLKKGELYVWTSEIEASFQTLKKALIIAPVLALPDFTQVFEIETDAFDKDIGAVLQQNGIHWPLSAEHWEPRHMVCQLMRKNALQFLWL